MNLRILIGCGIVFHLAPASLPGATAASAEPPAIVVGAEALAQASRFSGKRVFVERSAIFHGSLPRAAGSVLRVGWLAVALMHIGPLDAQPRLAPRPPVTLVATEHLEPEKVPELDRLLFGRLRVIRAGDRSAADTFRRDTERWISEHANLLRIQERERREIATILQNAPAEMPVLGLEFTAREVSDHMAKAQPYFNLILDALKRSGVTNPLSAATQLYHARIHAAAVFAARPELIRNRGLHIAGLVSEEARRLGGIRIDEVRAAHGLLQQTAQQRGVPYARFTEWNKRFVAFSDQTLARRALEAQTRAFGDAATIALAQKTLDATERFHQAMDQINLSVAATIQSLPGPVIVIVGENHAPGLRRHIRGRTIDTRHIRRLLAPASKPPRTRSAPRGAA